MPITKVAVELSNGMKDTFYYPSNVVLEYIKEIEYPLNDFIILAIKSLDAAQDRVVQKYGHQCIGCFIIQKRLNEWQKELDPSLTVLVEEISKY
ncbi:MAG: hypothetical protein GF329_09965 [Candidatus Lokiarchaeota archaeon]|nr:hypothetical protein [Candidatus Lokiarchaeota archaeon]